jgi:putative transposase
LKEDIREVIKKLCAYKSIDIVEGAICKDHIHICVSIPPKISISDFMGYLKGKSALMIFDRYPELSTKWNKSFWARGYYVSVRP